MIKRLMTKILLMIVTLFISILSLSAQETGTSIQIPSIDVYSQIVNAPLSTALQTWDVSHLRNNVGHMEYTPWFGNNGNIVLGAHSVASDGSRDVFYELDSVAVGDEIIINDNGTTYIYEVTETTTVGFEDTSIILSREGQTLTLITCDPASDNGSNFYSRRHVVFAVRKG